MTPDRIIAIDWSGAHRPGTQRKAIYIADWRAGKIELTADRTRQEICDWLVQEAAATPHMLVGIDFAFSFPAWFLRENGCGTAADLWRLVSEGRGEEWLRECRPPFWGRPGKCCPSNHRLPERLGFRQTDSTIDVAGTQPKSPFQIGGAGAVGTGSIRGMPILHELRMAGFHIWPFDPPGFPLAVEIYPRFFTGPVKKSQAWARAEYLRAKKYSELPSKLLDIARGSEDAFDALISVLGMADAQDEIAGSHQATDTTTLLEGAIWRPKTSV